MEKTQTPKGIFNKTYLKDKKQKLKNWPSRGRAMLIHQPNHFCERWLPLIIEQTEKRYSCFFSRQQDNYTMFYSEIQGSGSVWGARQTVSLVRQQHYMCDCFLHVFLMLNCRKDKKKKLKTPQGQTMGWAKFKESNCTSTRAVNMDLVF